MGDNDNNSNVSQESDQNVYLDQLIACLGELDEEETDEVEIENLSSQESAVHPSTSAAAVRPSSAAAVRPSTSAAPVHPSTSSAAVCPSTSSAQVSNDNAREPNNNTEVLNDENDASGNTDNMNEEVLGNSPGSRRPSIVRQYITSSSAKRRMVKSSNCQFCNMEINKFDLQNHLENNEVCKILYCRKYRVKEIKSIMVILFNCLFCDQENVRQLAAHLKSNNQCRQRFLQMFNIAPVPDSVQDQVNKVTNKVKNCKRAGYKSRTSLKRAFENSVASKSKRLKLQEEPMENSFNSLLTETSYLNFKKCSNCLSNIDSAVDIDEDSDVIIQGYFDMQTLQANRRLEKVWLCKFCLRNEKSSEQKSIFKMLTVEQEDKVVYYPVLKDDGGDLDDRQLELLENGKTVEIMFPTSIASLNSFDQNINPKSLSNFDIQKTLFSGKKISCEVMSQVYEHQLSKYKKLKLSTDIYSGEISDEASKLLSNVRLCPNESRISESDAWNTARTRSLEFKMAQRGNFCMFVQVEIPISLQLIANKMIQDGKVLNVDYVGEVNKELQLNYYLHTSHNSESDCLDNNCPKEDLKDYLERENIDVSLNIDNVSTYIEYAERWATSFIKNIVVTPSSSLSSSHYDFQFHCENNKLKMVGVVWPTSMQRMNLIGFDDSLSDEDKLTIRKKYLDIIDQNVSTSSNDAYLKSKFKLTENDSKKIAKLVQDNQINICTCSDCSRCQDVKCPSVLLMFSIEPDCPDNIYPSKRLLRVVKNHLFSLSTNTIKTKSTLEWIQIMWNDGMESSELNDRSWKFVLFGEEYLFKLTDRLVDLMNEFTVCPLSAAYHYSLQTVAFSEPDKIILKRMRLLDTFTDPYYIWYLKAAQGPVKIDFLKSIRDYNLKMYLNSSYSNVDNVPILNHKECNVVTALSLLDQNKLNVRTSSMKEFIYTGRDARVMFKKVSVRTANSYKHGNGFFEIQESMISRFSKRVNGTDLCLCEFVVWFDYLGSTKSEEQYDLYRNKIEKIPMSKVKTLKGEDVFLPELILCETPSKATMTKRRKPKTLEKVTFDEESYDFRHSSVILFREHNDVTNLTEEAIEAFFEETDNSGERIVTKNERFKFSLTFYDNNFIGNNFRRFLLHMRSYDLEETSDSE